MLRPWKVDIRLDYNADKAIYLQIADAIISAIQIGRLKSGDALPGSRNMAEMLHVNRNTVVEALNVLLNEEWIVSKERKGAFVADVLPISHRNKRSLSEQRNIVPPTLCRISFDDGYPDTKIAPVTELARAYKQIFNRNARWQILGYGNELGDAAFRNAIGQMLNQQRGMHINSESICITRGSQMAMYLTAQCLISKGDCIVIENPGYKPAWKAFEAAGARLLPVRVDSEGLVIEDVIRHLRSSRRIKAIYTTPHHQYPTTVTLSLQRRLALIRLSNEYGFTVIEDDYDNEFHFGYRPVLPLSSFPELQHFVYIGTMSKVVAPALRIGYVAGNDTSLIEKIGALRKIIDVQGDSIMEQAVLQLIADGTIKKHVKKATLHYKARRDLTQSLLDRYLKGKADYHLPDGGLAIWLQPVAKVDWQALAQKLLRKGIKMLPPDFYHGESETTGMRLGYGALGEEELEEGIKALAKLL
ncbi:PLP-dependent aminotransferase family protein [Chitinophaga filiformis]|uniref:PLP-dependent aminotransferase family protein n=1 Tax=Chitinophaga filiformis TaxID=104663 RepID=A0ABY4I871_CHIFI|nr:PLP-dependent aminotransferase family protein [Chitinophaga filiformis]UPK72291.1 PLP-dependent aminotransferase family protein [Chitinophaga filiformis]